MHKHPLIAHPLRALIIILIILCFVFVLQNLSKEQEAANEEIIEVPLEDLIEIHL
jgi:hypothetical protein